MLIHNSSWKPIQLLSWIHRYPYYRRLCRKSKRIEILFPEFFGWIPDWSWFECQCYRLNMRPMNRNRSFLCQIQRYFFKWWLKGSTLIPKNFTSLAFWKSVLFLLLVCSLCGGREKVRIEHSLMLSFSFCQSLFSHVFLALPSSRSACCDAIWIFNGKLESAQTSSAILLFIFISKL